MRCAVLPAAVLMAARRRAAGPLPYGVAAASRDVRAVARMYRPRPPLPSRKRPAQRRAAGAAVRLDVHPDAHRAAHPDARPVAARSAAAVPY